MAKKGESINFLNVGQGLILTFLILLIGIVLLTILISLFNFSAQSIDQFLFLLNYLALFIGGFTAAYLAKKRGWLHGSIVAVVYLSLFLLLALIWTPITFSFNLALRSLIVLFVAALGGMIGVNLI